MKVLLINGSTKRNGTTYRALTEVAGALEADGIATEIVQLGGDAVRDCLGCGACRRSDSGHCVFDDDVVNGLIDKAREADGFVFGSPVFYSQPTGKLLSVLHRMFYAAGDAFAYKPGAAVVTLRRAGSSAALDAINKFMTDMCMPVVSSNYWNQVFGPTAELAEQDAEGLQTMRNLGANMAWLLHCIEAGRAAGVTPPEAEKSARTNFNR